MATSLGLKQSEPEILFEELVEGINDFTSGEVIVETLLGNSSRKIPSAFIARISNDKFDFPTKCNLTLLGKACKNKPQTIQTLHW